MLGEVLGLLGLRYRFSYWLFYALVAWFLAWGAYWTVAHLRRDDPDFQQWHWSRVFGLVLVLWPFVQLAYNIVVDFGKVLDPNSVARTISADVWWDAIRRRYVQYVLVPLSGLFLAFGLHQRLDQPPRLRMRLRNLLQRTAIWPRHTWTRDVANGAWLFVVVYFGYLTLSILLSPVERLNNGDESRVFDAITPTLALALALMAGITEELLFRGILQVQLQRIAPVWAAIALQSVFFGLIHSGYGTIGHILFPALFGVMMGVIMLWFGLVPAIMIHASVNLVIFLSGLSDSHPWTLTVVPAIFFIAIAFPGIYYTLVLVRRMRGGGGPEGPEEPHTAPAVVGGIQQGETPRGPGAPRAPTETQERQA